MARRIIEGAPRDDSGKKARQRKRPGAVLRRKGGRKKSTQAETQEGPIRMSSMRVTIRLPPTRRSKKGDQQEKEEPEGEQPWGWRIPPDRGGGGHSRRSPYPTGRTCPPKTQSINHLGRVHNKAGGDRTRRS